MRATPSTKLWHTSAALAGYVATALRLSTPLPVFAGLRRHLVEEVITFDALRSYTLFETPEMRIDLRRLQRTVREFLTVLSVGRGLFFRVEAYEKAGAEFVLDRLHPTLETIAAQVERFAADPTGHEPRRLRRDLASARASLRGTAADLESMAGRLPFEPLANALLILNRVGDLLHGLTMAVASEMASVRRGNTRSFAHQSIRRKRRAPSERARSNDSTGRSTASNATPV